MSTNSQAMARLLLATIVMVALAGSVRGELLINEIYFDPPHSGGDVNQEYIELRGTPGMSLDNTYLILLENEISSKDTPADNLLTPNTAGQIEFIVDLNGRTMGSNGFLTLRQRNSPYTHVAAGATNLINTGSGVGWGTGPANNNIGVSSNSSDPGKIENSGFTAMLINKGAGSAPTLGLALDGSFDNDNNPMTVHDGLDNPNGQPGWSLVDSIGVFSETKEVEFGRTYSPLTFGPEVDGQVVSFIEPSTGTFFENVTVHPNLLPGQKYVGTGLEIEHIARYGNSTGSDEHDWSVSNLTDDPTDGWINADTGFLMSGSDPHGLPRNQPDGTDYSGISFGKGYLESESSQYIPYGSNMTNTLGSANYPLNLSQLPWDYNHDGVVDAADYTYWQDHVGQTDPTGSGIVGNPNRSGSIDMKDFESWKYHFGESLPGIGAGGFAGNVPEPGSLTLALVGMLALAAIRMRRGSR